VTSACPRHAVPVLDAGSERSAAERSKRQRELGRLDAVRLLVAAILGHRHTRVDDQGRGPDADLAGDPDRADFVPAGLVIADPDAYRLDGFAGDRLGVLLAQLLPLAAWSMPRRRQRTWK